MSKADFDVVVYGASSFVGQIIVRYMLEHFDQQQLAWAIAGRSEQKLEQLKSELGGSHLETIVADAADEPALEAMCARARVIMSTVGPYALYGSPLVKACVESGTHYCDLAGETQWITRMQNTYEQQAKDSGAWIVHCCGFDSMPSDLGVHFLQNHAMEKFGKTCESVKMGVAKMKGGASGGTIASIINLTKEATKDPALRKELANPYATCPPDHGFTVRQHNVKVEYDEDFSSWMAPFVMAAINTRVVHRSNALKNKAYGEQFKYQEAMMTGKGSKGKNAARMMLWGLGGFMIGAAVAPVRWTLERFVLPKPGEGPSEEEQLNGGFRLILLGDTDSGEQIRCEVTGDRDPGYGSTAKMISQAAACLAHDIADDTSGGFWTPATLLGDPLIQRLEAHAGLEFSLVK
ncbi:MAG: saccharopine dehydrogenase NADP-binding domain-containing protein [Pseudomonadota bacterium]